MLRHADGLSLYGTGSTGVTNMLQGVFAEVDSSTFISPQTTNPYGQGTHHLRFDFSSGPAGAQQMRRTMGATLSVFGFGASYYFSALPSANERLYLFQGRDNGNAAQFTVALTSVGEIEVREFGESGTVRGTSAQVVTTGAYQHIELFADVTAGDIEIRRNGQSVLTLTGVDIGAACAQYAIGKSAGSVLCIMDVTNLQCWDDTTADANDFLGDVQWLPWRPTSDEAASAWVRNTGSNDFDCIDDTTPDGDTTYIEAASAADISEFGITNCPANTADIIAVITQPMLRKTDAGDGTVQTALLSADIGSPLAPAESNGAAIPITETYTYYPEVHPVDPATGVRWTPSGFNAARLRLERTA